MREIKFNETEVEKLDAFIGTCHLCDRQDHRVVAIDVRFQHLQTAYCAICLRLLLDRVERV